MAAIHVLEGDGQRYRVVAHITTPAGSNKVGNTWAACIAAAGLTTSVLPTGTGLGQITSAEVAELAAGTKFEVVVTVDVPGAGLTQAKIAALVQTAVNDELQRLKNRFDYYGYTQ